MITSFGKLHYSENVNKWWLVVWCDNQISDYQRHLYYIHHHKCDKLIPPAWQAHITLVRNEEPLEKSLWRLNQDKIVEFEYDYDIQTDGDYWWLPVYSERFLDLREELGLNRNPEYPLHLSIGRKL